MVNRCRCGTYTNLGRTCSKCVSSLEFTIDWGEEYDDLYEDDQTPRRKRKRKKVIDDDV